MVEVVEEYIAKWEHQGKKIELRISGKEIEIVSDDGQSFKAPSEVWGTVSAVISSRHVEGKLRKKTKPERDSAYPNQGQPWTVALDERLKELWRSGETTEAICAALGRNMGGIASRLVKLEIVSSRDEARNRKAPQ